MKAVGRRPILFYLFIFFLLLLCCQTFTILTRLLHFVPFYTVSSASADNNFFHQQKVFSVFSQGVNGLTLDLVFVVFSPDLTEIVKTSCKLIFPWTPSREMLGRLTAGVYAGA